MNVSKLITLQTCVISYQPRKSVSVLQIVYHPYKISIELNAFCFTTRLLMTIQLNLTILEKKIMMTRNLSQAWHYIGIERLRGNNLLSVVLASQKFLDFITGTLYVCLCISKRCICADLFFQLKKTTKRILYPV